MDSNEVTDMIDELGAIDRRRKQLESQARKLRKEQDALETKIKQYLLENAEENCSGAAFSVENRLITKPKAIDWMQTHSWIKEHDAIDLLEKRLSKSAVLARWEDGVDIPGVVKFNEYKLLISEN